MTKRKDREKLSVLSERAVMVAVLNTQQRAAEDDPLGELRALVQTAGAEVVGEMVQKKSRLDPGTYLGKGKMQELGALVKETKAGLVVFDNDLSPAQVRNLERGIECKIVDRSELILDIFANRATTTAAKLQVEIAQLEYTFPRLKAMWDHLGQVTGGAPLGIGTRGPGEQQLEIDRRLVKNRLEMLKSELERIQERTQREVSQRNVQHFTVGLVGYTNAGKSTLFNRLTVGGGAFEHAKLFATLGTRVERWELGGGNSVMLSDTVGFIRDLPHHLVASFRSTLEETVWSQLLLVVVDVSDAGGPQQLATVQKTLDEIGARRQPRVLVLNKVDAMQERRAQREVLERWKQEHPEAVLVSAATGEGLEELKVLVRAAMMGEVREVELRIPMSDSRTVDYVEKRAEVKGREYDDGMVKMRVRIGKRQVDQLLAKGARFWVDGYEDAQEGVNRAWGVEKPARAARERPHEKFVRG